MKNYNKIAVLACNFFIALNIAACGRVNEDENINIKNLAANQQESDIQTVESTASVIKVNEVVNTEETANQQEGNVQTVGSTASEIKEDKAVNTKNSSANQQENNVQTIESTVSEKTSDELLDLFINGSISAVDSTDSTSTFYVTDLNMNCEEWQTFSIGEKVDLDNDGENELVINGPYGGMYLDARDNKVYKFAVGGGTALVLSYTCYNGDIWIMYSNKSSAGFEFYHMEKFEGADNLVAEMNFGEEFDINNVEAGLKYTLNGAEISYDEYTALCSKIFAAEVSTSIGRIKNNDKLEILAGEYEYQSDYGTGKLIIKKTAYGYDISDYESESSYRFLADSSNIDFIKNNRIYIKYPEQIFSDDTVIFSYYILEYSTDEINVYYAKSADEDGKFLYHATRKSERNNK